MNFMGAKPGTVKREPSRMIQVLRHHPHNFPSWVGRSLVSTRPLLNPDHAAFSPEQPLQEPAAGLAVEPEAAAVFVFHPEVVPLLGRIAAPPLAGEALRTFGADDPMQTAAPAEAGGGIVGQQGHGLDRLGPRQQPQGARRGPRPGCFPGSGEGRTGTYASFR